MTGPRLASALLFAALCATAAAQTCFSYTTLSSSSWAFGSAYSYKYYRVPASYSTQYVAFVPTDPVSYWSGSGITFSAESCPTSSDVSCSSSSRCTSSFNNMITLTVNPSASFSTALDTYIYVNYPSIDYGVIICSSSDCSTNCYSSCGSYEFCNATTALCECSYSSYSYSSSNPSCSGTTYTPDDASTLIGGSIVMCVVLVCVIPVGILCCIGMCVALVVVLLVRSNKKNGTVVVSTPPQMMMPIQQAYPQQAGYPPMQQTGYPPMQQPGYPPQEQTGYPSQQQQTGYPPVEQQTGYPPVEQQTGYPPVEQQGYPPA